MSPSTDYRLDITLPDGRPLTVRITPAAVAEMDYPRPVGDDPESRIAHHRADFEEIVRTKLDEGALEPDGSVLITDKDVFRFVQEG
jgi:hypothetical protein